MESERLRNSLLATLSHDLRTPLAALQGLGETLALTRPALTREQLDIARAITQEARRLAALVNNLLDMARIESGEVKLRKQWHAIEEVVGSALLAAKAALGQRRVDVRAAPDLPLVEYDAILIERVLYNLVENAAKYTPPDATIAISAEAAGGDLVVRVSDTGPGIAKGQEDAIFDKFSRGVSESTTPGVGLGLAISRAIVEAHGGRISAANSAGGGAVLTFTLPLGSPPVVPDEASASSAPGHHG